MYSSTQERVNLTTLHTCLRMCLFYSTAATYRVLSSFQLEADCSDFGLDKLVAEEQAETQIRLQKIRVERQDKIRLVVLNSQARPQMRQKMSMSLRLKVGQLSI
jgi:hypothetical protein